MADSAPDQQPGTGQLGLVPKIINPMDNPQSKPWSIARAKSYAAAVQKLSEPDFVNVKKRYLFYPMTLDRTKLMEGTDEDGSTIDDITKQFGVVWRADDNGIRHLPVLFSNDDENKWYYAKGDKPHKFIKGSDLTNVLNEMLKQAERKYILAPFDYTATIEKKREAYGTIRIQPGMIKIDISRELGFAPDRVTAVRMLRNSTELYSIYENNDGSQEQGATHYVIIFYDTRKNLVEEPIKVKDGTITSLKRMTRPTFSIPECLKNFGIGQLGAAPKLDAAARGADDPGIVRKEVLPEQAEIILSLRRTIISHLQATDDIAQLEAILTIISSKAAGSDGAADAAAAPGAAAGVRKYLKYKQKYLQLKLMLKR
jgi:hypothetical protein